jgi:hypothetical protein
MILRAAGPLLVDTSCQHFPRAQRFTTDGISGVAKHRSQHPVVVLAVSVSRWPGQWASLRPPRHPGPQLGAARSNGGACAGQKRDGVGLGAIWVARLRYFAAVPVSLAPKAVPGGPTASGTCWCVFMRMLRSAYRSTIVAVSFSCQNHGDLISRSRRGTTVIGLATFTVSSLIVCCSTSC